MKCWKHIIFPFFFFIGTYTFSQVSSESINRVVNPFDQLDKLYKKNNLNDTVYMGMVDSLAVMSLDQGVYYSNTEMLDNLKQYEKIAWSKNEYGSFRIDYFIILLNNSFLQGEWGTSVFYAEKIARQNEKEGEPRSFIEPAVKIYIYGITEQEDKQIETYEKHQKLFEELALKIKEDPEKYHWDGKDALRILTPVINTYYYNKDTLKAKKAHELANSLVQSIQKDTSLSSSAKQVADFYAFTFNFYKARGLGENETALTQLNKMQAFLKNGDIIGKEYEYNLLDWKAHLFLDMKQVDSAFFYIEKMEKTPDFVQNQKILINKYKARLESLKGNPEKANEYLNRALKESSKMRTKLAIEMDKMLYAQTEAEHHRLAFEKSEQQKKLRNQWIGGISLFLISIIFIIIILLRKKDKKLKGVISNLEAAANVQIALMDQIKSKVRKEEQNRISQELHDDLAGTLAAIKNNVDLQVLEFKKTENTEKMIQLSAMIEKAFQNVRNKSHELFEKAQLPDEEMFGEYIIQLAQVAFPEKYYNFNIEIDEHALANTSIELRSELIRVIQEAFTNIVKHAKASQVDLLIYKENETTYIVIKDNGVGLRANVVEDTLGLKNMKNRLKKFKAEFYLKDITNGVEVVISIPEDDVS